MTVWVHVYLFERALAKVWLREILNLYIFLTVSYRPGDFGTNTDLYSAGGESPAVAPAAVYKGAQRSTQGSFIV